MAAMRAALGASPIAASVVNRLDGPAAHHDEAGHGCFTRDCAARHQILQQRVDVPGGRDSDDHGAIDPEMCDSRGGLGSTHHAQANRSAERKGRVIRDGVAQAVASDFRRLGPTTQAMPMLSTYSPTIGAEKTISVTGSPVGVMTAATMTMMRMAYLN